MQSVLRCLFISSLLFYHTAGWSDSFTFLNKSTHDLVTLNDGSSTKKHLTNINAQSLQQRRYQLIDGLKHNSSKFVKYLLPSTVLSSLPQSLKPYIESEVTNIEGRLEIRVICYSKKHKDTILYLLKTDDGKQYYLNFYPSIPNELKTGQRIRVSSAYLLIDKDNTTQLFSATQDVMIIRNIKKTAIPSSLGQQKTIVFLINFKNEPTKFPWTTSQVNQVVVNDTSSIFLESSYQQTSLVGKTVGWYTADVNSTDNCNTIMDGMTTAAAAGAKRDNIDLTQYTHLVYLFPHTDTCEFAGVADLGTETVSQAWLNGYLSASLTGHELGHNLGLYHSKLLVCDKAPGKGNCTEIEYGDPADIMGSGYTAHFNSFQKDRLGWLNYRSSPPIQTVTTSGTYNIDAYETTNNNFKAIRIPISTSDDYYYIELRQPIGFDKWLDCSTCDYTKGLLIHHGKLSSDPDSSLLFKLSTTASTQHVFTLLPGKSFVDPETSLGTLTITTNSVSPTGASVTVSFDNPPPTCHHKAPNLYIFPPSIGVTAGKNAYYKAQILNNDDATCAATSFNLSLLIPSTLKGSLGSSSLTVTPGAYAETSLQVNTTTSTPANTYAIRLAASHPKIPNSTVTADGSLLVKSACTKLAPSVTFIPASQTGKSGEALQYNVTITNRDTGPTCSTSLFGTSAQFPSGFSVYFPDSFPPIQPGKSVSQYLTLKSGSSTPNGTYSVSVKAISVQTGLSGTGSGQYIVKN